MRPKQDLQLVGFAAVLHRTQVYPAGSLRLASLCKHTWPPPTDPCVRTPGRSVQISPVVSPQIKQHATNLQERWRASGESLAFPSAIRSNGDDEDALRCAGTER